MFDKSITFRPAYDKRDPDPQKDYGIGDVKVRFVLKGPEGAVQLRIGTGWFLQHCTEANASNHNLEPDYPDNWPTGYGIQYHSPKPMYPGHLAIDCDVLDSGKCYSDGLWAASDSLVRVLIEEGTEGVWKELHKYYCYAFFPEDEI